MRKPESIWKRDVNCRQKPRGRFRGLSEGTTLRKNLRKYVEIYIHNNKNTVKHVSSAKICEKCQREGVSLITLGAFLGFETKGMDKSIFKLKIMGLGGFRRIICSMFSRPLA